MGVCVWCSASTWHQKSKKLFKRNQEVESATCCAASSAAATVQLRSRVKAYFCLPSLIRHIEMFYLFNSESRFIQINHPPNPPPGPRPGMPCSLPFIPLSSLYNEVRAGGTAVRRIGAFQRHCGPGHTEIDHLRTCHSCLDQIWIIKWPEAVKCLHCLLFSRCF